MSNLFCSYFERSVGGGFARLRSLDCSTNRLDPSPRCLDPAPSEPHGRGVRVVDGACLESMCRATYRGFESLPLRNFTLFSNPASQHRQRPYVIHVPGEGGWPPLDIHVSGGIHHILWIRTLVGFVTVCAKRTSKMLAEPVTARASHLAVRERHEAASIPPSPHFPAIRKHLDKLL